jgi:ribosomal-protein-alanine N-acetyltransferase
LVNAIARPEPLRLVPMTLSDLDAVMAVEQATYEFPWTRGNMVDSVLTGHLASVLLAPDGLVVGYFVAMVGVEEMHLLNLTVAPAFQRQGHARALLDVLVSHCREHGARRLWLEVRPSNARARRIYERYGFRLVGMRRGYYPAGQGRREDAQVMSLDIDDGLEATHALD